MQQWCISEMGHAMWYVKLLGSPQDDELLSGLCLSPRDMHFYAFWEEQSSWHSPRECPSGLVRACKHRTLSFIYRRVINSLGIACFSQVTFLLVTSLKAYLLMSWETWKKSQLGQLGTRFPEKQLSAEDTQVVFYRTISTENKWFKHSSPLKNKTNKNLPHLGQSSALQTWV